MSIAGGASKIFLESKSYMRDGVYDLFLSKRVVVSGCVNAIYNVAIASDSQE